MNIVAYTAKRYERATRRVVGRRAVVITCPPYDDGYFIEGKIQYGLFGNYDLAVFNLHGFPNLPVWLGDDQLIAMKGSTLSQQRPFAPHEDHRLLVVAHVGGAHSRLRRGRPHHHRRPGDRP